jgi:hypothetical protein
MALKSLADGKRIKQFIRERQVKSVVIMGMGYIALEMAEALNPGAFRSANGQTPACFSAAI